MSGKLIKSSSALLIALTLLLYITLFLSEPVPRIITGTAAALALLALILYLNHSLRKLSDQPTDTNTLSEGFSATEPSTEAPIEPEPEPISSPSHTSEAEQHETRAHQHIVEALFGMAKVVPILNGQLQAVIDYTEEAAMELSRSFISINRKAKEQVDDVRRVFGTMSASEDGGERQNALVDIRENLNSLTSGLATLLEQIKKNSESINSILHQTKSIEEIVATTSEITENSRVLSINATIEAARAGEHGRGFAVVAGEFKQMTERSEAATAEIEETVRMISQLIASVQKEIEESEDISRRLGEETKSHGRESLDKIDAMMEGAKQDLQKLSEHAESFAQDIKSIIVSIQFQDITRQRIEHVIEPLKEFASDMEKIGDYLEHIDRTDSVQKLSSFDSALDRLKQKYTMEAEKELLENSLTNENETEKGES
ncbi:MAG: hypothetical protein K9M94_10340 [Spirochaetia bacterium]|nr:hypothetical protein [Spirochaetia bacterium]